MEGVRRKLWRFLWRHNGRSALRGVSTEPWEIEVLGYVLLIGMTSYGAVRPLWLRKTVVLKYYSSLWKGLSGLVGLVSSSSSSRLRGFVLVRRCRAPDSSPLHWFLWTGLRPFVARRSWPPPPLPPPPFECIGTGRVLRPFWARARDRLDVTRPSINIPNLIQSTGILEGPPSVL